MNPSGSYNVTHEPLDPIRIEEIKNIVLSYIIRKKLSRYERALNKNEYFITIIIISHSVKGI